MPGVDSALAFELGDSLFAAAIEAVREARGRAVLVGLCGSQASGKSTTAGRLAERLGRRGARTIVFSIDDFYLTLRERRELAARVHPLLATRGVPGTHDMILMAGTIHALLEARPDSITSLPRFDKASDDRMPRDSWPDFQGRPDVVILEGWCVGARPPCLSRSTRSRRGRMPAGAGVATRTFALAATMRPSSPGSTCA